MKKDPPLPTNLPLLQSVLSVARRLITTFSHIQTNRRKKGRYPSPQALKSTLHSIQNCLKDENPLEKIQQGILTATREEEDLLCMKGITLIKDQMKSFALKELQESLKSTPSKIEQSTEKGVITLSKVLNFQNGQKIKLKGKFRRIEGESLGLSIPVAQSFEVNSD